MPKMVDIADQLMDKWGRLNPGEEVDVPADMTRLTLDTIALCGFGYRFNSFYRDTPHPFVEAMVRTLAESQARARQLPDPDPAEDPGAAAGRGGPGVHERPGRPAHRRAPGRRATRRTPPTCSAGCSPASTSRRARGCPTTTSARSASPSSSPATRRPPACCPSRSTTCSRTRTSWRGPAPRSTRCSATRAAPTFEQVHRLTYVRQVLDESLRLWPTAPGLHPLPVRGHRDRRPVRDPGAHPDHGAHPGAAPRPRRSGGRTPRSSTPTTSAPERLARDAAERLQAVRHRPAGLHRAAVRLAGGDAGARHAAAALRLRRPPATTSSRPRPRSPSSPTTSASRSGRGPACRLDRGAAGRPPRRPPPRRRRGAGGRAGPLVARHGTPLPVLFGSNLGTAESIATRLAQEGTERGFDVTLGALDDHVDDLPAGGAVAHRHARPTTARRRTTPPRSAAGSRRRRRTRPTGVVVHGLRLRQHRVGRDLPGGADAARRRSSRRTAASRVRTRAARATPPATSTPQYRAWHGGAVVRPRRRRSTCRPRSPRPAPAGPRLSITLTNRQVDQPGDRVLRGAARPRSATTAS